MPLDTWSTRLVIARTQRGLSQEEAAERCGVTRASWSTWERGVIPRGQAEVTRKISSGLGYDLGWLMWGGPLRNVNDGPDGPDGLPRLDSNQRPSDYTADTTTPATVSDLNERRRNARSTRHLNPFRRRQIEAYPLSA